MFPTGWRWSGCTEFKAPTRRELTGVLCCMPQLMPGFCFPIPHHPGSGDHEAMIQPSHYLAILTLIGVIILVGALLPRGKMPALQGPARWLIRRRWRTLFFIPLLAFAVSLTFHWIGPAVPSTNDDFCQLLAADTFAHGRLANPTHPLWMHFESIGVSHRPSYASKHPPLQGLVLACGQVLFGMPLAGSLMVFPLACAAVIWMLWAWVGRRWALVGGLILAFHPYMQKFSSYYPNSWTNYSWVHGYTGGALAMLGGALLYGALRRILWRPTFGSALMMGLGLAVLANTRPFEGVILSLPAAILILQKVFRLKRADAVRFSKRVFPPLLLVMVPCFAMMMVYNRALTGHYLRLPHVHYAEQYGAAAEFLFLPPRAFPPYRNSLMEAHYHEWVRPSYELQLTFEGYWLVKSNDFMKFWDFYLRGLWPGLIGCLLLLKRRWWRLMLAVCLLQVSFIAATFQFHPHYAAPLASVLLALILAGFRELIRLARVFGSATIWMVQIVLIGFLLRGNVQLPPKIYAAPGWEWPRQRMRIERKLLNLPGRHLVIVRYQEGHSPHRDWVHNGADLDLGRIVWARELGRPMDDCLLEYYRDRSIWLLQASQIPPRIVPYALPGRETGRAPEPTGLAEEGSAN